MKRKITIKNPNLKAESAENWFSNKESMKHLAIDVPASVHSKLKIASAKEGKTMGYLVRDCLVKYLTDKS